MRKSNILYYSLNSSRRQKRQSEIVSAIKNLKDAFFKDAPISKSSGEQTEVFEKRLKTARSIGDLVADIEVLPEMSVDSVLGLESFLIKYNGKLSELCIILDYLSFIGDSPFECEQNASKVRSLIIEYPEVNFSFDETIPKSSNKCISFKDFLFFRGIEGELNEREIRVKNSLIEDLHSFTISDLESYTEENSFIKLCYYYDNLFDPSNIRNAIKVRKYIDLNVAIFNFEKKQKCREENLALCIEEERSQNLFNCYSAFANGYRCLPVVTALGLKWANNLLIGKEPQLILRDYDLQFPDEVGSGEIDKIRGWHFNSTTNKWTNNYDDNNEYWRALINTKDSGQDICHISKGDHNIKLKIHPDLSNQVGKIECDKQTGKDILVLPGIYKPVSGVYTQIQRIKSVERCYTRSESDKGGFNKKRKDGIHGVPLDIYYMVKRMLDRARNYYEEKRFVHAAVLAQDILEVLNGFHEAMMLEAYHLVAVSENAISMNTIGGSEKELKHDSEFRVNKIRQDVTRMTELEGDQREDLSYNILSQIFVDCRDYCKDKEHFEAEETFISAMARLTEGFNLISLTNLVVSTFKTIKKHFNDYLEFCKKEDNYWFMNTIIDLTNQLKECNDNNGIKKNRIKRKYKRLTKQEWEEITVHAKQQVEQNDDEIIEWRSSNEEIASIDNKGLISPHRDGLIVIFSIYSDRTTCYPINVKLSTPKTNE